MPRIRGLKPDFFKDEYLAELPFEARLLFAGLWCYADKKGRLEDRPKYLKAEIFPYDKVDIEKLLNLLTNPKISDKPKKSFIRRYIVNDVQYIDIPTFLEHQNPHHTEKESEIPEFNGYLPVNVEIKKEDTVHCSLFIVQDTVKDTVKDTERLLIREIISHLNQVCGTDYKPSSKKTIGFIEARFREGFTVDNFKTVIDKKYAEWGRDDKMCKFLRPETLFGTKFESYLNQPDTLSRPKVSKSMQNILNYMERTGVKNEEGRGDEDIFQIDGRISGS